MQTRWAEKVLHERNATRIKEADVDKQQTKVQISANRPDIVIKNNRVKKCTLIDVTIPCDKNTSRKVSEKFPKYTYIHTYIHTYILY